MSQFQLPSEQRLELALFLQVYFRVSTPPDSLTCFAVSFSCGLSYLPHIPPESLADDNLVLPGGLISSVFVEPRAWSVLTLASVLLDLKCPFRCCGCKIET